MRQCFRTASREAYSRAQPGYLQTNRCVLPVTKILQQSTAAIPFVASGWSELRGGRFALGFGATPIPSTGFCTTPILLTRRTQPPARPTTHLKGTQPAHSPPTKRAVLPILPNYGMSSP